MRAKKARLNKPFEIGIWCDGWTSALPRDEVIGFTHTLAEGLLALNERLEVVLFVRPEDVPPATVLQSRSGGRLRVVPQIEAESSLPGWLVFILRRLGPWLGRSASRQESIREAARRLRARVAHDLRDRLGSAWLRFRKSPVDGLVVLMLGGFLAAFAFLVYWPLYAVKHLLAAAWRSLLLPWTTLHLFEAFRRRWQLIRVSLDPLVLAKEENCDVWLIPSSMFQHSLKDLEIPTVVVLSDDHQSSTHEVDLRIAASRAVEATLCVSMSPALMQEQSKKFMPVDSAKIRHVPPIANFAHLDAELRQRTLKQVAAHWLRVFHEAVVETQWHSDLSQKRVESWPRLETVLAQPNDRLRAFLFLPANYCGGILQVTKELVSELATVNRERKRLELALGLLEEQGNIDNLNHLGAELPIYRMRIQPITRAGIVHMMGGTPGWLAARPEPQFCFLRGAEKLAFQADAWFSVVDRFPQPLLPARPLGVLVHDVLQRPYPQFFDPVFFKTQVSSIIPTCRAAEVVVTMTPQTRDDVIAEYGLEASRVRLIPVACNPHWHFSRIRPQAVANLREPFILNVTNCNPHKGPDVLLHAYALLKRRLGATVPRLVMCGYRTQVFSPAYQGTVDLPYWQATRQLVRDLDLVERRDVGFLGSVSDEQLRDLYERCSVVVNAARYDNGCLCLAEGAYFGRPVVSSRYPAAEFHAQRFGYQAHFFPVGDPDGLADALVAALQEPPKTDQEIERARTRFLDPEFSFRRYGERVYDLLIQLAEAGRRQKLVGELRHSA